MEGCSREALEGAARNGHLEVVRLLHDIRVPCTATAIHLAYLHGHMDVYNFLGDMYPDKVGVPTRGTSEISKLARRTRRGLLVHDAIYIFGNKYFSVAAEITSSHEASHVVGNTR